MWKDTNKGSSQHAQVVRHLRAARAAGVARREIQKRIADGDLESFEGRVDYASLLEIYPRAATVPFNMLEHVENPKEAALHKSPPGARSLVPEPGGEAYARASSEAERFRRLARDRLLLLKDMERRLEQLEVDVKPSQRVRALTTGCESVSNGTIFARAGFRLPSPSLWAIFRRRWCQLHHYTLPTVRNVSTHLHLGHVLQARRAQELTG